MISQAVLIGKREFHSAKTKKDYVKLWFDATPFVDRVEGSAAESILIENRGTQFEVGKKYTIPDFQCKKYIAQPCNTPFRP